MTTPIPKAFLSFAADDSEFVERVYRQLPHGQAFFFKQSFANGAYMLEVMEREVANSHLFVLFASKASVQRQWIKFEAERARLARISDGHKRLQVYAADGEVQAADLPEWMREYWFDGKERNARDVARLIASELTSLAGRTLTERMYGRGSVQGLLHRRFNEARRQLGGAVSPNVVVAAGVEQIGRATLLRHSLPVLFPALPHVARGPEIELPGWGDLPDFYRALGQYSNEGLSLEQLAERTAAFGALNEAEQVEKVIEGLSHFGSLGEAVVLRAPSFLFDRAGHLKEWVRSLIAGAAGRPDLILAIVTNRQIPEEEAHGLPNVCQLLVGSIDDDDIRLLIDELSAELSLPLPQVPAALLVQIGGHPVLARAYVRLAEQYGPSVFDRSPEKLFVIQEGILQDNFVPGRVNDYQRKILHVLSWVPSLDAYVLEKICSDKDETRPAYIESLNDLILGCMVEVRGPAMSISGPVRSIFRRTFGYGDDVLLARMADVLKVEMADADAAGAVSAKLVDAVTFMYVLTGTAMPKELRDLLLPGTLEEIVRSAYNSGREDDASYDKAIQWGMVAEDMRMDEAVREEILSSVIRAHIRKEDFRSADDLLRVFDKRDYRSRFFLRGFRYMREGRVDSAIPHLINATKERRYYRSAANQLGIAYFRKGDIDKLKSLLDSSRGVEQSAFLLDLRIQYNTAEANYPAAEQDIQLLARLAEDNGRARKRRAILLAKRDGNFQGAIDLVSALIDSEKGRAIPLRFLRGILAAKAGRRSLALQEAEFVRANARRSGPEQYAKIKARLAVAEGDWRGALDALEGLPELQAADRFLRVDALRLKAEDHGVAEADRAAARSEAAATAGRAKNYTDLDFAEDTGFDTGL